MNTKNPNLSKKEYTLNNPKNIKLRKINKKFKKNNNMKI